MAGAPFDFRMQYSTKPAIVFVLTNWNFCPLSTYQHTSVEFVLYILYCVYLYFAKNGSQKKQTMFNQT